jgi:hypothetical protein
MSTINYNFILLELLNELRNEDILSIAERGVTTTTDSFDAAGGAEVFTLTESGVKNVRSVVHEGTTLSFGTDYTFNYTLGNIVSVSVSKELTLNDEVDIAYDYGTTDGVYSDWSRPDLTLSSYPRLSFNYVTLDTEVIAVGGVQSFNPRIQFRIMDFGVENTQNKMNTLRSYLKTKQQGLYYSNILRIVGGTPCDLVRDEGKGNKIYQMNIDVINELNIER